MRCLISVGDDAQAVHVLMDLARHLLEQDQYDDVRSTYSKFYKSTQIKKAKRLLSRVHHLAGGQAGGEDAVVCVPWCLNDRDQEECKACHASLHMTSLRSGCWCF